MDSWALDRCDRQLVVELQARLPDKIIDSHAHLLLKAEADLAQVPLLASLPDQCGLAFWEKSLSAQTGAKQVTGGLFFGWPVLPPDKRPARISRINRWLIQELAQNQTLSTRGLLLLAQASDPHELEQLLQEPRIVGFKPYPALNPHGGSQSDIGDFLPEWACELANTHQLIVLLHIQKPRALDDEQNIQTINALCKQYPRMQLVLAHAGTAFNMYNTISGCSKLVKADNLWFDVSAICESQPLVALLKRFGPQRLLWGSDFPVSLRKGRYVTLGCGFIGIQEGTVRLPLEAAALLGLENLRAVLQAVEDAQLAEGALEALFYGNAKELLGF